MATEQALRLSGMEERVRKTDIVAGHYRTWKSDGVGSQWKPFTGLTVQEDRSVWLGDERLCCNFDGADMSWTAEWNPSRGEVTFYPTTHHRMFFVGTVSEGDATFRLKGELVCLMTPIHLRVRQRCHYVRKRCARPAASEQIAPASSSCSDSQDPPRTAVAPRPGTYETAVRWGGNRGKWVARDKLHVADDGVLCFGECWLTLVASDGPSRRADGPVRWLRDCNPHTGAIQFFESADGVTTFDGWMQHDGEGPIDFRGTLKSPPVVQCDVADEACSRIAVAPRAGTYETAVRWGGNRGKWMARDDLQVTDNGAVRFGECWLTRVMCGGPSRCAVGPVRWMRACNPHAGAIQFFESADGVTTFDGWMQHDGEGPIDFRGTLKSPLKVEASRGVCMWPTMHMAPLHLISALSGNPSVFDGKPAARVVSSRVRSYETAVRWGGDAGSWHAFDELTIDESSDVVTLNGRTIVGVVRRGLALAWDIESGANPCHGTIVMSGWKRSFVGYLQYPNEGPIEFKGDVKTASSTKSSVTTAVQRTVTAGCGDATTTAAAVGSVLPLAQNPVVRAVDATPVVVADRADVAPWNHWRNKRHLVRRHRDAGAHHPNGTAMAAIEGTFLTEMRSRSAPQDSWSEGEAFAFGASGRFGKTPVIVALSCNNKMTWTSDRVSAVVVLDDDRRMFLGRVTVDGNDYDIRGTKMAAE